MDSFLRALDNAADGAFVIDGNQRIIYWNAAAQKMFGYSAEEVAGRSCYDIIRGRDDHDHAWCRNACHVTTAARAGEVVETFNTLARTKAGNSLWINVSILSLPGIRAGEGPQVVHLCRDATELKRSEQFAHGVISLLDSWPRPAGPGVSHQPVPAAATLLTERELEVLQLMAEGKSTQSISELLSISRSTTRNHIQNVLQKLHVHSRAEAVAYAFEHGLVSVHE